MCLHARWNSWHLSWHLEGVILIISHSTQKHWKVCFLLCKRAGTQSPIKTTRTVFWQWISNWNEWQINLHEETCVSHFCRHRHVNRALVRVVSLLHCGWLSKIVTRTHKSKCLVVYPGECVCVCLWGLQKCYRGVRVCVWEGSYCASSAFSSGWCVIVLYHWWF